MRDVLHRVVLQTKCGCTQSWLQEKAPPKLLQIPISPLMEGDPAAFGSPLPDWVMQCRQFRRGQPKSTDANLVVEWVFREM